MTEWASADEHEARVVEMLDDLAAANAIPESIKLMNEAAARAIANGALGAPLIARALLKPSQ